MLQRVATVTNLVKGGNSEWQRKRGGRVCVLLRTRVHFIPPPTPCWGGRREPGAREQPASRARVVRFYGAFRGRSLRVWVPRSEYSLLKREAVKQWAIQSKYRKNSLNKQLSINCFICEGWELFKSAWKDCTIPAACKFVVMYIILQQEAFWQQDCFAGMLLLVGQRVWAPCSLIRASVILNFLLSGQCKPTIAWSPECIFSRIHKYFNSEIWTWVCPVSDLGHQTVFLIVCYTEGLCYQTSFILSIYPAPEQAPALCFKSVEAACGNMKQSFLH